MPSSDVKSNAGAGARSLVDDQTRATAAIVAATLSGIRRTAEDIQKRQRVARQDVQAVGTALSDYGSAPKIGAPAQEVEHWREAISVVAERGKQMTHAEAETALDRISEGIDRAGAANLVVSTANQILEENNLAKKPSIVQESAPAQPVADRLIEGQPNPAQLSVIGVADNIYDAPTPAETRHELPPKLMDYDQQMETLGTAIKNDTEIPKDVAQELRQQYPEQSHWTPDQKQSALALLDQTNISELTADEMRAKYEKETSVEPQQGSSGPTEIEGQASSQKVYEAEEFRIVRGGNKTTIETVKGQKLFEYTKDDSGKVTVTLDKITGNVALRKQFEKAASALKAEPAHEIMHDPTGRKQIDKLGGLAPIGSHAIAVAAYVTNSKHPITITDKYEFRKTGKGYEVNRRGPDIKNRDVILAKSYQDGRIASSQSLNDYKYMKENFEKMRSAEIENVKAVEVAEEARANGQPVINSRVTAIEKERG